MYSPMHASRTHPCMPHVLTHACLMYSPMHASRTHPCMSHVLTHACLVYLSVLIHAARHSLVCTHWHACTGVHTLPACICTHLHTFAHMHAQTRTQTWPRQDLQLFVGCNDVHVEGEVWQGMMHTAKVTPLPSLPRLRSPPPPPGGHSNVGPGCQQAPGGAGQEQGCGGGVKLCHHLCALHPVIQQHQVRMSSCWPTMTHASPP